MSPTTSARVLLLFAPVSLLVEVSETPIDEFSLLALVSLVIFVPVAIV